MNDTVDQLAQLIKDMFIQNKFTEVLEILDGLTHVSDREEMLCLRAGCLIGTRNFVEIYDLVGVMLRRVSNPNNVLLRVTLDIALRCGHIECVRNIATNYLRGVQVLSTTNILSSMWFGFDINIPFLNISYEDTEDNMCTMVLLLNYLIKRKLDIPFKLNLHKFASYTNITCKSILKRSSYDYLELMLNHTGFSSLAKLKLIQNVRENSNPKVYNKVKNHLLKKTNLQNKKYITLAQLCSETIIVEEKFDWIIKCYDLLSQNALKSVSNIITKRNTNTLYEEEKMLEIQILLKQQLGEYDEAKKLLTSKLFESKTIMISLLLAKIDLLGDTRDVKYSKEIYLNALLDGLSKYETLREVRRRLGLYYICSPDYFHDKKIFKSFFPIDLMVDHYFTDLLYHLGKSFESKSSPCLYSALYIYLLMLTCKLQGQWALCCTIVDDLKNFCLTIPRWIDKIMKVYSDDYIRLAVTRAISLIDEIQQQVDVERCPYEDLLKPLDVNFNFLSRYHMIIDKDTYDKLDLSKLSQYLKNILPYL